MSISKEMQIGIAGEHLACADIILKGGVAFLTDQGLPYDIIIDMHGKLLKCQVKTTSKPRSVPQRNKETFAYIFNIKRHGKKNNKKYTNEIVDIFALVCLDTKQIAYIKNGDVRTTMNFRVPSLRGTYYDEQGAKLKSQVTKLREKGLSCSEVSNKLKIKMSSVYKYSADVDISPKGNNSPVYFDEFSFEKCLEKI